MLKFSFFKILHKIISTLFALHVGSFYLQHTEYTQDKTEIDERVNKLYYNLETNDQKSLLEIPRLLIQYTRLKPDFKNPLLFIELFRNKFTVDEDTYYALLEKIRLEKNNLNDIKLQKLILVGRKKSVLDASIAEYSDFDNSNFSKSDLRGAIWEFTSFDNSNFDRADLSDSIIACSFFRNSNLNKVAFNNSKIYKNYFYKADMREMSAINSDFRLSNFTGADLSKSFLHNANFDNTVLLGADLRKITGLESSSFTKATYNSSQITYADVFMLISNRKTMAEKYCTTKSKISFSECVEHINKLEISPELSAKFDDNSDCLKKGMFDISDFINFARINVSAEEQEILKSIEMKLSFK